VIFFLKDELSFWVAWQQAHRFPCQATPNAMIEGRERRAKRRKKGKKECDLAISLREGVSMQ